MRQIYQIVGSVTAAIVVCAVVLKYFELPWFWVGLTLASSSFAIAAAVPTSFRFSVVVIGSVPIAVSIAELVVAAPPVVSKSLFPQLDLRDALLGWRPAASQVSREIATADGELIYDVTYSIDQSGHRISPPDQGTAIEGCAFFFADSFVYGEGVGDQETLPYQVGLKARGRFRVVNFAYAGYGAEHMLATIERGELATNAPCDPTHVFYIAQPHHVLRAAGKTDFSVRGPRYRLGKDGTPEYLRTSPDQPALIWWQKKLTAQLSKSRVYRALTMRPTIPTEQDLDLYFAIVRRSFDLLGRRWPRAQLHVVSWDLQSIYARDLTTFHDRLKANGLNVHFIEQILPGYVDDPARYSLHRFDLHPNPFALQKVATYVVERILKISPQAGQSAQVRGPASAHR